MMCDDDFRCGVIAGVFVGIVFSIIILSLAFAPVNIEYDNGYQTIDVCKITKYSDGMQIIETTNYNQIFGYKISQNYSYYDPNRLITNLGIHIICQDDSLNRSIISVVDIVDVISY